METIKKKLIFAALLAAGILTAPFVAKGNENDSVYTDNIYTEPVKLRGTCYLPTGNKTASGTVPMQFRTVAGRREDLGKTCLVYSVEDDHIGQLIFIGVIEDTGGHKGLKNGTRVDFFMESKEEMNAFIKEYGDYFYVSIMDGVG